MGQRRCYVPGLDPVRKFPYYKLQVWDEARAVWMDIQRRFESPEEIRCYAAARLSPSSKARVMIVEDYGRRRVDDSIDLV